MPVVRIGTRTSALARAQADMVASALLAVDPSTRVEVVALRSGGDDHAIDLAAAGSAGVFVNALRAALLVGEVDVLVHSLKDLPTAPDPRFALAAVPERLDPSDVFVAGGGSTLEDVASGGVVGTSSPRRACWIRRRRPDLQVEPIRGNVETRLAKVLRGEYAGTVLAFAGLSRLGLFAEGMHRIPPEDLLPAPGQAALAVECRAEDADLRSWLASIDEPRVHLAVAAERAVLRELGATCATAAGAHAVLDGTTLTLSADVMSVETLDRVVARDAGAIADLVDAESLGTRVARTLMDLGALALISPGSSS